MRLIEKLGTAGAAVSVLGCAGCFPAMGTLAGAIGLGFLSGYEGIFINTLLPSFAIIVLVANLWRWTRERQHVRGVLGCIGPVAVLATLYPLWAYGWSTSLLYAGIAMMIIVSLADLVSGSPTKMSTTKDST